MKNFIEKYLQIRVQQLNYKNGQFWLLWETVDKKSIFGKNKE